MSAMISDPATVVHDPVSCDPREEDRYVREQLITCLGNKRALLPLIDRAVGRVKRRLGRPTLAMFDAFAGSGVVSRLFKRHAHLLISNDFEPYAAAIGRCYLANRSSVDMARLREAHRFVLSRAASCPVRDGFIRRLYAPADETDIKPGERVFYTVDNARRIDTFRTWIEALPAADRDFFLGPLLAQASVHANTSGVFKGFYKDARTGIGQYGGRGRDALKRILGSVELPLPVLSRFEQEVYVHQRDANALARDLPELDAAYLDPPYNQHPYGSNYFMLNLIAAYQEPSRISRVSGIPHDWQRSRYNRKAAAAETLEELIESIPAAVILISYNDEGFISRDEFDAILSRHGKYEVMEAKYNAFRGSRNLRSRAAHVTERLFVLERS